MNLSEFKPHAKQKDVLLSPHRFNICVTGIRGGKTLVGAAWLLQEIYKHYSAGLVGDYLILAPTVKILHQAALPTFMELMPPDWGTLKEQKQEIELAWGKRIFLRSTDEPNAMEGITALGLWYDEAGMGKEMAWVNAQGRLSMHRGRAIITTTPYFTPWFKKAVYDHRGYDNGAETAFDDRDKAIAFWNWRSIDNPHFPADEYERAKKTMSDALFQMRYDGKFTKLTGLVYKEFDAARHVVKPFVIPASWKRFAGLDFGHSDPTVVLCIAVKPEEKKTDVVNGVAVEVVEPAKFFVYREFYRSNCLLHQVSEFLNEESLDYGLGDPSAAQEITELRQFYGHKRLLAADNKIDIGIQRIQTLLKENRLFFFENRATNTLEEIESYCFLEARDKPEDKNNHAMDALKYAFSRQVDGLYSGARKSRMSGYVLKRTMAERQVDPYTGYSFF